MELAFLITMVGILALSMALVAHLQKRIDKLESIMNAELAMARDSLYLAKKQLSEHEHQDKSVQELLYKAMAELKGMIEVLEKQLEDHKDSTKKRADSNLFLLNDKFIELKDKVNYFERNYGQMKLDIRLNKKKIEKLESGDLDIVDTDKMYSRREVEDYLNINQYQRTKLVKDGLLTEHRKAPKWPDLSEYYYDGNDVMDYVNKQKEVKTN